MKKLILVLVLLLVVTGTSMAQSWGKDSVKVSKPTLIISPKGLFGITSFIIRGTANTDSLKIYHSIDQKDWRIVTARTLNWFGNDDTTIVNAGAGVDREYMVMYPNPYYIMIKYVNKVILSTRRIDIEYYNRKAD